VFDYGLHKQTTKARDYEGGRDATGIINYVSDLLLKTDIEPDIFEISL